MENARTLIQRRENPKDIWYHLYEFPCEEQSPEQMEDGAWKMELTHVLSHQKIHARFVVHKVQKMPSIEGCAFGNGVTGWYNKISLILATLIP